MVSKVKPSGLIGRQKLEIERREKLTDPLSEQAKGRRPFAGKKPSPALLPDTPVGDTAERQVSAPVAVEKGVGSVSAVVQLDPFRIKSWSLKDRTLEELEDDADYLDLVEAIRTAGRVLEPIKVRPLKNDPDADYEEVFGFKRLHACKRLELPVDSIIEEMSDAEAFQQQAEENRGRSEPSAWSKAVSYKAALDTGAVRTEENLAERTGKDVRTLRSYLRVVEIMPDDLKKSIKLHRLGIQALFEIRSALLRLSSVEKRRFIDLVVENADKINDGRGTQRLISSLSQQAVKREAAAPSSSRTINSDSGKLFSVNKLKQGYSVKMHFAASTVLSSEEVEEALQKMLSEKGVNIIGPSDDD